MVVIQVVLLHIALLNRPPFGAQHSLNKPFAGAAEADALITVNRPYNFWQWRSRKPYWQFIAAFSAALVFLQLFVGNSGFYIGLQGFFALSIEAFLPIPQILENQRIQSCKGFRLSVLVNWLLGDFFKMSYFFLSGGAVPLAFKLCGLFQAACDCYLGVQYWMYGAGENAIDGDVKSTRVA